MNEIPQLFPPGHYYSPIVDPKEVSSRERQLWGQPDTMPGIDSNLAGQFELLRQLKQYTNTIRYPRDDPGDERTYFYDNDQYPVLDAEFLHAALCHFRPRTMIEVGSGFSSLLTAEVNRRLLGGQLDFACIEPFPRSFLARGVGGITRLVPEKVQDLALSFFDRLEANDILFIDSSHVSKAGSDVNHLVFNVLPRLRPGELVHVHDIFLADDYPRVWVTDEGRNWNEQYLMRAFLQFNSSFEIVWIAHYMGSRHTNAVQETFPRYPSYGYGGSLWIRRSQER